jgi:GSH-dependent disulfide-bond oxidoreductase
MIEVYTSNTPNGIKVPIALEELGLDYQMHLLDLSSGIQKHPTFLQINPNGRIPAIVDTQANDGRSQSVFESGAILVYLAEKTDRLLAAKGAQRISALEYLFLQVGGIGPMFGQAGWFMRSAPVAIPIAIERYQREAFRLTSVVEQRLQQHEWLSGGEYSIADIMNFCWLRSADYAGVQTSEFPAVKAWLAKISARPAVQRALTRLQVQPFYSFAQKADDGHGVENDSSTADMAEQTCSLRT